MEFFKQADIDWMGRAKYFVALSLTLLLVGGVSWYSKGRSLRYGIDFKAGTQIYVRFAQPPSIEQIRKGLAEQGLGSSVIQKIADVANPNSNEVLIDLEQQGQGEESLDAGKTAVLKALNATFGTGDPNKLDLNAATPSALAEYLTRRDPLGRGPTVGDAYTQLARRIVEFRDRNRNGILTNLDELKSVAGVTDGVVSSLRGGYYLGSFTIRNVEIVGPKVGAQLRRQAFWVTLSALGGMLVYIAFRFELVYGAAAVLAVFHDVLITLGFFSLLNYEISLTVIAALLTLVGYSMNDTIVIFDRIRENTRLMRREPFAVIVNRSINQTLSRTILTSGLTFLTVLVLYVMGGQVLRSFSFALVVGIVVGTYSSFGIAAPLVVAWNNWRGQGAAAGTGSAAGNKARAGEAASGRLAAAGRR